MTTPTTAVTDQRPLACEVRPIQPVLNFGLRFQAGYLMRVPLRQFAGPGHRWYVLVRITPQSGEARPVHLLSVVSLPDSRLGIYLLDVSGHGVGAALLSFTLAHLLSPTTWGSLLTENEGTGASVVPPVDSRNCALSSA